MQTVISAIGSFFGAIMSFCYSLVQSYGFAIILFTIVTKFILMPVNIWTHRNSLKVIKMMPEINRLKIDYFGDKDTIAEKQAALYKREKYNPLASLLPLAIQIIILMGVIEVIYHPLTHLLHMDGECVAAWLEASNKVAGIDITSNPAQLRLLALIQQGQGETLAALIPTNWQGSLATLEAFNTKFLGVDLTWIASEMSWIYLFIPVACGLSSLFLAVMQNHLNPLQHEQKSGMQLGTLAFSVGLSLYLGYFVPAGVALYWIAGNVFAVAVQILMNTLIDPKKHVNYEALAETRKELEQLTNLGKDVDPKEARALIKREKADYKRFFSVVNKHLVFYSESNGFYKYFKGFIEYILEHSNLTIHYITSDPNDKIFEMAEANSQIRGYYIGEKKLITLMMKMDADVVVMTMPDLQNYHIKRSYVRDDIEYILVTHGLGSRNMTTRKGSTDHYDTLFLSGVARLHEEEQISEEYKLPPRNYVKVGYPLIDEMRAKYKAGKHVPNEIPKILIAPSWQKDNIIDTCLETILEQLKGQRYNIIVRPHPQEVRLKRAYILSLKEKYEPQGIEVQDDFSSNNPVLESDLLITDWSDISFEYAYTTYKPVLFINTPMKVMNPEYQRIKEVPINIVAREKIGLSLNLNELDKIQEKVDYLLFNKEQYNEQIEEFTKQNIYNLDCSAPVGGEYIIETIKKKIENRKEGKK